MTWITVLFAALATHLAIGLPTTPAQSLALGLLSCLPVIILFTVFRGAPARTIAEVLYDTDQKASDLAQMRLRLYTKREPESDLTID